MEQLAQLLLQNLLGVAASVVAAVVGWLITRRLRTIFEATERTEQHVQAAATSARDSKTASEAAEASIEELTAALHAATAALDTVRENNDRMFTALLKADSQEIRIKRIEQFMADIETERFRSRINSQGVHQ